MEPLGFCFGESCLELFSLCWWKLSSKVSIINQTHNTFIFLLFHFFVDLCWVYLNILQEQVLGNIRSLNPQDSWSIKIKVSFRKPSTGKTYIYLMELVCYILWIPTNTWKTISLPIPPPLLQYHSMTQHSKQKILSIA